MTVRPPATTTERHRTYRPSRRRSTAPAPEEGMRADSAPSIMRANRGGRTLKSGKMVRLREDFLALWDDRPSRWCLILGAVYLWLALTLLEPTFLAPLLASAAAIWSRRGHRAATTTEGVDDWF
jgi:hypothetical protein